MKIVSENIFFFFITFCICTLFILGPEKEVRAQDDNSVFVVQVEGLVDKGLYTYIQRSISAAETAGAPGVILHIDTFGGLVDAADKIRKALLDAEVPVVAFIDRNAASAGALIALACDSLFMSPGSSIGAATVVDGTGEKADEKMQSYMRGLMRATAEARDRDPRLAEAMVDERIAIDGVIGEGELLTLSSREAVELGLADASLRNLAEVMEHMGWQDFEKFDVNQRWEETVLRFLSGPVISSILMLMMLGGLYFELQSPGVGFPGAVASLGALLFFAPLYIMGLAQSWEIIIFAIGVGLIIVEIFVLPGFGVPGLIGVICIIFGLLASMIGNVGFSFPAIQHMSGPIWTLAFTLITGIALAVSMARYMPKSQTLSRLILANTTGTTYGYTSATTIEDLIGMEGVTLSTLRPSGTAKIDNRRIDVVSDGDFIESGEKVKVVASMGSRVVVTRIESGKFG